MKYWSFICIFSLLIMSGCSSNIDRDMNEDLRVYICASVDKAVDTRTPYVPSDDADTEPDIPDDAHPLSVKILASTDPQAYVNGGEPGDPESGAYYVAYHTAANFKSGNKQLLEGVIYSKDQTNIYFTGMHPEDGWTVTADGRTASYTSEGHEDVMYAHKDNGYYSTEASVFPIMVFHHLMTWLRFEIKAQDVDIAQTWGKIKEIQIHAGNKVEIDLTHEFDNDNENENWKTYISHPGPVVELPLYAKGTDDVFPGAVPYPIPYNSSEEVAYVMCAPVNASAQETDYLLDITTENRSATVSVNLKAAAGTDFSGSTMGKQFTLLLTFKPGNNIAVSANVTDWKNGCVTSGVIE